MDTVTLTAQFIRHLETETEKTRVAIPVNENMMVALMEEVGELAKALLQCEYENGDMQSVYGAAVQVASVALRIATEGDDSLDTYNPPPHHPTCIRCGETSATGGCDGEHIDDTHCLLRD